MSEPLPLPPVTGPSSTAPAPAPQEPPLGTVEAPPTRTHTHHSRHHHHTQSGRTRSSGEGSSGSHKRRPRRKFRLFPHRPVSLNPVGLSKRKIIKHKRPIALALVLLIAAAMFAVQFLLHPPAAQLARQTGSPLDPSASSLSAGTGTSASADPYSALVDDPILPTGDLPSAEPPNGSPTPNPDDYYLHATYPEGNGVLSLRFDDGFLRDYIYIYPNLISRNLTAGFALIRNKLKAKGFVSVEQAKIMQASGMEIMCHSYTHTPDPKDWNSFVRETTIAGEEMKGYGLSIYSWVEPGNWWGNYYKISSTDQFGQMPDLFLRQYFKAYEADAVPFDAGEDRYKLPRNSHYGVKYVIGDLYTAKSLQDLVDTLIKEGMGTEILFHPVIIGTSGFISEADFEFLLDYLQTKVNEGVLTVLTPIQQLYSKPVKKSYPLPTLGH